MTSNRNPILLALVGALAAAPARGVEPPPVELPATVTLEDALKIFRAHGLELLIAEAAVESAAGDVRVARQFYNPNLGVGYSHAFNYSPAIVCMDMSTQGQCSPDVINAALSDNAAISDIVSGKRGLRIAFAEAAHRAAKMARADAQRTLEFQLKQQYLQAVLARDQLDFALEVQKSWNETNAKAADRRQLGAISEADAAKIETAKLEADQAVSTAQQALRIAKVGVAYLLGVRGTVPDFHVEQDLPKFAVPPALASATEESLLRDAFENRPDVKAQTAQEERATAGLSVARRAIFPDLELQVGFATALAPTGGANAGNTTPPTLSLGISGHLPLFYQQQGEIQKAEADIRTQGAQLAKVRAQVASDVAAAHANYRATRDLVERMEGRLLDRARTARDLTKLSYEKGAVSLLEYLDASRTFIAITVEYLGDLANYWIAVSQLEQAVGMELRK